MNHSLCLIRRLGLVCAMATLAVSSRLLVGPLPVQAAVDILYFTATGEEDRVVLQWATAQELDNVGFNLYRAEVSDVNQAQKLNQSLIPSECFGEICGATYSYSDLDVVEGVTYYYWLESIDTHSVGELYRYDPESATPGPSPTPTFTATPTPTATYTPTSTATSTSTVVPSSTPTTLPTATPSFTPTWVPTSTPTSTPPMTPSLPPSSSPSSTSVVEQRLSPTLTPVGTVQPTLTLAPAVTELTTPDSSAAVAVATETPSPSTGARGDDTEPGLPGWSPFPVDWPTIQPSTTLLFISLISLLGVLFFSVALALVRKLSL